MKKSQYPTISAEITELQHQIKQIDLPGKNQRATLALTRHEKFTAAHGTLPLREPERLDLLQLATERRDANTYLVEAERDTARITHEINHLTALLNADTRTTLAQKQVETAAGLAAAAQTAVDTATGTHTEIATLVAAETQAIENAKGQAASAMLAQIKAGAREKLHPVNREHLDTLLLAQEAAAVELQEAQEAQAVSESTLGAALHEQALAHADTTARTLHLVAFDYAQALSKHMAATSACGQYFDAPDIDILVRHLAISDE